MAAGKRLPGLCVTVLVLAALLFFFSAPLLLVRWRLNILSAGEDEARAMAEKYVSIFGRDNFFIELQDHGLAEQKQVLPRLVRLAG